MQVMTADSMAGRNRVGIASATSAFLNVTPCTPSSSTTRSRTCPYWPRPPVCFAYFASPSSVCDIAPFLGTPDLRTAIIDRVFAQPLPNHRGLWLHRHLGCTASDRRIEMAKKAAKRELINTGTDKRYVRRNWKGQFKESDDVGRSLAQDRRQKAK